MRQTKQKKNVFSLQLPATWQSVYSTCDRRKIGSYSRFTAKISAGDLKQLESHANRRDETELPIGRIVLASRLSSFEQCLVASHFIYLQIAYNTRWNFNSNLFLLDNILPSAASIEQQNHIYFCPPSTSIFLPWCLPSHKVKCLIVGLIPQLSIIAHKT